MRAPPFSVCRKRCSTATLGLILPLPHVLQRGFGVVEYLCGFLGEDRRDLGIEVWLRWRGALRSALRRRGFGPRRGRRLAKRERIERLQHGAIELESAAARQRVRHPLDFGGRGVQRIQARIVDARTRVEVSAQLLGERRRQRHRGLVPRHASAAQKRMARAIKRLVDCVRPGAARRLGEKLANHAEVAAHLLDENVREHRIHAGSGAGALRLHSDAQRLSGDARGVGVTLGERLRLLHQQLHVELRRQARFELLQQLRQRRARFHGERDHARRRREGLVDELVQQVLDAPRKLADQLRADHAAAAFQRMERAARRDQRFGVRAIGCPERQIALNARDLFLRFLDEHLDELGVRAAFLDLHDARRRCGGLLLDGLRARVPTQARPHARRLRYGQPFQQVEAALRVVEHVPRIGAPGADRLEVVLDADDRVGEPLEVLGFELRAGGEPRGDHRADTLDDRHGLRLARASTARPRCRAAAA